MKFLKRSVAAVLSQLGYEIRRKTKIDTTLLRRGVGEVLTHMKALGFTPETIIDVGVGQGTPGLWEAFPESKLLLIEPLAEVDAVLQRAAESRDAKIVRAAAGATPGRATLWVHNQHLEGSSLLRETQGKHADGDPREVALVTIDDVRCDLPPPYLMKLDVQGAELQSLDGAKETIRSTDVVILEASLFRFQIGGPEFYDYIVYMKDKGFVVYDIFGGRNRPLDLALAQVDLVFVREDGAFRQSHRYA